MKIKKKNRNSYNVKTYLKRMYFLAISDRFHKCFDINKQHRETNILLALEKHCKDNTV